MIEFIKNNTTLVILSGGMSVAGIVNILRLMVLATEQWNISPVLVLILLIFMPEIFLYLGTLLVLPALIVCIIGMISLHNQKNKEYHDVKMSDENELIRIYQIHHPLNEEVKPLAKSCQKIMDRISFAYILGLIGIASIVLLISNIWIVAIAFVFYMFAFNVLIRYRNSAMIPIISLLYEKCDPEACASAIIYFSTRRNKVRLKQHTLFAQCLIYMDDPELAQDVLVHFSRKDRASNLLYWSLMSCIYYLLKDEESLVRCKEEVNKLDSHNRFGVVRVVIENKELAAIQNKIDLMNGDLNTCKKYYLNSLHYLPHPFQQVDANYYIALISFVQKDYPVADLYFKRVVANGNKMCFVKKAQDYLSKLEQMDINLDDEYQFR